MNKFPFMGPMGAMNGMGGMGGMNMMSPFYSGFKRVFKKSIL
jgi:hypothetical protein